MTSLALTLVAALAAGQADAPPEHMKVLQPLVGQWIYIGPAQSDTPVFGPKGTEVGMVLTYTWAINKNALQIQWVGKADKKKGGQFVELVGWDSKQKKLVSHGFGSGGGIEHNVWSRDGETVVCDTTGVTDEGKDVTMKYLHTIHDDTLTLRYTDITIDGVKQPDEEYKFRRVR